MNIIHQSELIAAYCHRNDKYGKKIYFDAHLVKTKTIAWELAKKIGWKMMDEIAAIAVLHDTIEDGYITEKTLKKLLNPFAPKHTAEWVACCVSQIARNPKKESYDEYIDRLISHSAPLMRDALLITKAADLICHITTEGHDSLKQRYHVALHKITVAYSDLRKPANDLLVQQLT